MALKADNFRIAFLLLPHIEKEIISLCFYVAVKKGIMDIVKFLCNENCIPGELPEEALYEMLQTSRIQGVPQQGPKYDFALFAASEGRVDLVKFFYEKKIKFNTFSFLEWESIPLEFIACNLFKMGIYSRNLIELISIELTLIQFW
jgi:hypothetical protein